MEKEKLKNEFITLIDGKIKDLQDELEVLNLAYPTIEEYAEKNSKTDKRLATKLEKAGVYAYIEKKESWTTGEKELYCIRLTAKETRTSIDLWPDRDLTEEQKTKMLGSFVKKLIDYKTQHITELQADKTQADNVIKTLEAVEQLKENLTKQAGRKTVYDTKITLPYSISGFINDNLPRW